VSLSVKRVRLPSAECNCVGSAVRGNVPTPAKMASGDSVSTNPDKLTLANVRDGHIKYKNLKRRTS
jgi:hypothetical protein